MSTDHRRQGELHIHRPLLRGPWVGLAGCSDSRMAAERSIVGEADGRTPGRRTPRHHLRPPRLRPLEQARRRLQLRHVRGRSRQAAEEARSQEGRAGGVLDGLGRGHPISREVRQQARAQGGADRDARAVSGQSGRQPGRRRRQSVRGHQGRDPGGSPRVPDGVPAQLLQLRRHRRKARERARARRQLERRRRRLRHRDRRLRRLLDRGLPQGRRQRTRCRRSSCTAMPTASCRPMPRPDGRPR